MRGGNDRDVVVEPIGAGNEFGLSSLGDGPAIDQPDTIALAWRHYVFESPHATDQVGEFAGTTGNTGLSLKLWRYPVGCNCGVDILQRQSRLVLRQSRRYLGCQVNST